MNAEQLLGKCIITKDYENTNIRYCQKHNLPIKVVAVERDVEGNYMQSVLVQYKMNRKYDGGHDTLSSISSATFIVDKNSKSKYPEYGEWWVDIRTIEVIKENKQMEFSF